MFGLTHLNTTAASRYKTSIGRYTCMLENAHIAVWQHDPFRYHTIDLLSSVTVNKAMSEWKDSLDSRISLLYSTLHNGFTAIIQINLC